MVLSLMTSILWWRMSQAGTQVDISTKFHTIVSEEKMLEQGQRINIS